MKQKQSSAAKRKTPVGFEPEENVAVSSPTARDYEITYNGKKLRVYHQEAGDLVVSKRIQVPLAEGADSMNPPVFELKGSWDRRFLVITEGCAIELEIVFSEPLIVPDSLANSSKYERIHQNLTRWRQETSPESLREIHITNPVWNSGIAIFAAARWPAIHIRERSLSVHERQLILNANIAKTPELHNGQELRKREWRVKGGAATLKLRQCPKEALALKQYIRQRAKSLGNRGMARAIRDGLAWFKTKYPDRATIIEGMHINSIRNFVTGMTGSRPKGNSKR